VGVDVRQQDPDPLGAEGQDTGPDPGQGIDRREEPAAGEFLARDILQDNAVGETDGGVDDGFEDGALAEGHFNVELLADHLVAQPGGKLLAGLAGGHMHQVGRVRSPLKWAVTLGNQNFRFGFGESGRRAAPRR